MFTDRMSGVVVRIRTHQWPDLDVIFSLAALMLWGKVKFPSLLVNERPAVEFVPAGSTLPKTDGCLDLDVGGKKFDHHGGSTDCTLGLMVSYLGIETVPGVALILDVIRDQDLRGQDVLVRVDQPMLDSHTRMAAVSIKSLVDAIHNHDAQQQAKGQVVDPVASLWVLVQAAKAVFMAAGQLSGFTSQTVADELKNSYGRLLLSQHQQVLCQSSHYTVSASLQATLDSLAHGAKLLVGDDKVTVEDLFKGQIHQFMVAQPSTWFVRDGQWQPESALFSILGVVYGLRFMENESSGLLENLLEALQTMDVDWQLACADWLDCKRTRVISFGWKNEVPSRLTVTGIRSDRINAMPAARAAWHGNARDHHARAGVVLVFNSTGMVQIQAKIGDQWMQKVLHQLGIALRMAEHMVQKPACRLKPQDFIMSGSCPLVPEWFIAPVVETTNHAFLVANGTLKNSDVPRTRLTVATIMRLAQNVFYFGARPEFEVIRAIVRIGQQETGWPEDSKRPWLLMDVRQK